MAYCNPVLDHASHSEILDPTPDMKHLVNTAKVDVVFFRVIPFNLKAISIIRHG